jgi:hypothetical protein
MTRSELIKDLTSRTEEVLGNVSSFTSMTLDALNHRNTPTSWTILECLEHLNLYGDFYLSEMENRISAAQVSDNEKFKSGWLGNYFALSMLPGENGKLNKMKTFSNMNPLNKALDINVIARFEKQQRHMLSLLNKAATVDLGKVKTSISISGWIKLKLGDTLRVVIYHNQRHMKQALGVLAALQHR